MAVMASARRVCPQHELQYRLEDWDLNVLTAEQKEQYGTRKQYVEKLANETQVRKDLKFAFYCRVDWEQLISAGNIFHDNDESEGTQSTGAETDEESDRLMWPADIMDQCIDTHRVKPSDWHTRSLEARIEYLQQIINHEFGRRKNGNRWLIRKLQEHLRKFSEKYDDNRSPTPQPPAQSPPIPPPHDTWGLGMTTIRDSWTDWIDEATPTPPTNMVREHGHWQPWHDQQDDGNEDDDEENPWYGLN